ncbi:WhiB family transcriptional regulator [Desertimonas flava]|jgi:WhiB family redox-sensing transcriptional regulator|uniref:WhiB family transcriptional regulator n=1 Tax=Desertimonas flava TaxID=2064846 RepID=UPI000E343641|nr:WhiB family transcriptional regulator [Desertimonas flava]
MDAVNLIKRYARCTDQRGTYSALFFSEDPYDMARAKAICLQCVARPHCLSGAIERQEPCGVWGGEIFVDGVPVVEKRGRGRPPRVPRPAIVVPEIPDYPELPGFPDVA